MLRELYLTPGGAVTWIQIQSEAPLSVQDTYGVTAAVMVSGTPRRIRVDIDALASLDGISSAESPDPDVDSQPRRVLAILAIIDALDSDLELQLSSD